MVSVAFSSPATLASQPLALAVLRLASGDLYRHPGGADDLADVVDVGAPAALPAGVVALCAMAGPDARLAALRVDNKETP